VLRLLLFLSALGILAGWGYHHGPARSSYSGYSEAQLQALRSEADRVSREEPEAQLEAQVTLGMLEDEQSRRLRVRFGLPVALLLGLAGWFAPRSRFNFGLGRNRDRKEEARLAAFMGNASGELEAERRQAAATLLGVMPRAPRAVIEAAFQAQMKERDRSRYDGVAPDLVRVAEEQREQLRKARDYLLQRS